jgi:hypothetical protein
MFKTSFATANDIVNEYKARKWWMMRGRINYVTADGKTGSVLFGHTREMERMLRDLPAGATVRRIDMFGGFGFFANQAAVVK